jgi:Common central domain of tyrosinase/von Willebrand factor type A domain
MDCRKNIYALTDTELADFIDALNELKASGEYDDFVARHHDAMNTPTLMPGESMADTLRNVAHRGPSFLPWHRVFLRELETLLRSKKPGVMLPYWDWAADQPLGNAAPLWNTNIANGRIYIGGDGDPASGDRVTTGPFTTWVALIESGGALVPRPGPAGLILRLGRDPQGTATMPTATQVTNSLSIATYDSAPWRESQATTPSFRNRLEGWLRESGETGSQLHNKIHLWVGGDMLPGTSPNDPVFFLHHCNVDRIWALWQDQHGDVYAPAAGGPPSHNLGDVMGSLTTAGATPQWSLDFRRNLSYTYDTSAPKVDIVNTTVNFNDVPEGETTFRAVVFRVYACTPVTIDIKPATGPSPPFVTSVLGTSVSPPDAPGAYVEARLWFQYTAGPAGVPVPAGSVTLRCQQTGDEWPITLTANSIERETVAVVLTLDQSGSMDLPAGTGPTRMQVLREAALRFVEIAQANNGIGVVRFDHDAYPGIGVTQIGAGAADPNRQLVHDAVQAHATNPLGSTSIGDGVELARNTITPVTGYDNKAVVVMTDGLENTPKFLSEVLGSIDNRTYAIGLGTAQQVSTQALTTLAAGTGGYLLLTGSLTPNTDDYFRLTKYFLQILAGVTNNSIVTDPSGFLPPGTKARIPFVLNETDIDATVVLLEDMPAIRLAVETPAGDVLQPGNAAGAGAVFQTGTNMKFYRYPLPLSLGGGARAGVWHALLEIDRDAFKRSLAKLDNDRRAFGRASAHGPRYSVSVHAYSNLRLTATAAQSGFANGATIALRAVLTEFGVPVERRALVRAEASHPDNTTARLPMLETGPGVFTASLTANSYGVYRFRIVAEGRTFGGAPFTREQTVTAATVAGGDKPGPTAPYDEIRERICHTLNCLLKQDGIERLLKEKKIDPADLRRCLENLCGKDPGGRG